MAVSGRELDIETAERLKYEKVWAHDTYRNYSPGERHVDEFITSLGPRVGDSVIDYGCGTGRAVRDLIDRGYDATGVDFAANCLDADVPFVNSCLWNLPDMESDWAYCTDVMEHIPPEKVDKVLKSIRERTRRGAFFSIATRQDAHGPKLLGEPLHLTIETAEWWHSRLRKHFEAVSMKPRGNAWATYTCLI